MICCNQDCEQGRLCPRRIATTATDKPIRFAIVLYSAALFVLFGLSACEQIKPCQNKECGAPMGQYGNGPDTPSNTATEAATEAPSAPAEAPSAPSEGKGHGGKGGHHGGHHGHGKGDHDDDGDED